MWKGDFLNGNVVFSVWNEDGDNWVWKEGIKSKCNVYAIHEQYNITCLTVSFIKISQKKALPAYELYAFK